MKEQPKAERATLGEWAGVFKCDEWEVQNSLCASPLPPTPCVQHPSADGVKHGRSKEVALFLLHSAAAFVG